MKKYIIIFVLFIIPLFLIGQQNTYNPNIPMIIPRTPQAEALARYGEYPVSHATGVPQIDIPLYEIMAHDIKIPISISYHASGIKVEDVATPVGLGWTLNTGGIITRSIFGAPDAPFYENYQFGSSDELSKRKYNYLMSQWYEWSQTNYSGMDTQSDRYVYNFNGKTGVFRYNSSNRELTSIPYEPIKIEETVNGFKIKDTDGLVYYFEEKEFNGTDVKYPSSWYLTKVESQLTGAVVTYKYQRSSTYLELIKSSLSRSGGAWWELHSGTFSDPNDKIVEFPFTRVDKEYHSKIINTPLILEQISWNNYKITFKYSKDRKDKYKDRLNSIDIVNGDKIFKSVILDNNAYWGSNQFDYRMRLEGLVIKGENEISKGEKYQFKYNKRNLPPYKNHGSSNIEKIYCEEDYWGYANGSVSEDFIPQQFALNEKGANREPNEEYMKSCSLEEIIYPTGGSTFFEFETNRSGNDLLGGLRIKKIISKTDGKEFQKLYEYTRESTELINYQRYTYTKNRYYSFVYYSNNKVRYYVNGDEYKHATSNPLYSITGWSNNPVFYGHITEYLGETTQNIGKNIYEYISNLRYTKYDVPEPDFQIFNYVPDTHIFWNPYYNVDQGLFKPLLDSEKTYKFIDNKYLPVKELYNYYTVVEKEPFTCGVRVSIASDVVHNNVEGGDYTYVYGYGYSTNEDIRNFVDKEVLYFDIIGYRNLKLLTSSKTVDYNDNGNIETTTNYTYDPQYRLLNPISQKMTNSNGSVVTETTKFPFNESIAPYPDMVKNNVIGLVTKQEKTIGAEKSIAIQNMYRKEGTKYLLDQVKSGLNGALESRIKYHNYDKYGNPLYITKDDAYQIVYLWSYNYQCPIAEIKNATYAEVVTALQKQSKTVDGLSAMITPSWDTAKFRTDLPNALISTYTYKPLVGMLTATDPSGKVTSYEYDSFGRLERIKDHEGQIMEEYTYNYANK